MGDVGQQIISLTDLDKCDLKAEWQRRRRAAPPRRISRDLLVRGIAHEIQVRTHGGLTRAIQKKLRSPPLESSAAECTAKSSRPLLKPGMKLVREWGGRTHTVVVLEHGFEYVGEQYRSLSKIAREITGARWSGPRFFGVI